MEVRRWLSGSRKMVLDILIFWHVYELYGKDISMAMMCLSQSEVFVRGTAITILRFVVAFLVVPIVSNGKVDASNTSYMA